MTALPAPLGRASSRLISRRASSNGQARADCRAAASSASFGCAMASSLAGAYRAADRQRTVLVAQGLVNRRARRLAQVANALVEGARALEPGIVGHSHASWGP